MSACICVCCFVGLVVCVLCTYYCCLFFVCLSVFVGFVMCAVFVVKAAELEELNRKLRKRRWYHQQDVLSSAYDIVLFCCFALLFCSVFLYCWFVLVFCFGVLLFDCLFAFVIYSDYVCFFCCVYVCLSLLC